jgi:hypothetical protein
MKNVNEGVSIQHFAQFVTIAAAIFVGGSGTLLVHHILAPSESPRRVEELTASAAVDPRLSEALVQLAKELHENRSATLPIVSQSGEPSQRSVATESGDSALTELAAAVRELRSVLQHGGAGGSAAAVLPAPVLPPAGQRAWLPELSPDVKSPDRAYSQQHMFWSEQQVLDHYGLPDGISSHGNGEYTWWYTDDQGSKRSFEVHLSQGRVTEVQLHH